MLSDCHGLIVMALHGKAGVCNNACGFLKNSTYIWEGHIPLNKVFCRQVKKLIAWVDLKKFGYKKSQTEETIGIQKFPSNASNIFPGLKIVHGWTMLTIVHVNEICCINQSIFHHMNDKLTIGQSICNHMNDGMMIYQSILDEELFFICPLTVFKSSHFWMGTFRDRQM